MPKPTRIYTQEAQRMMTAEERRYDVIRSIRSKSARLKMEVTEVIVGISIRTQINAYALLRPGHPLTLTDLCNTREEALTRRYAVTRSLQPEGQIVPVRVKIENR
jgi:hypothetical protein